MKNKIIYAILLITCLYIGILYHYPQVRFLVAFVLLLPVTCQLSLFIWRGRCRAEIEGDGDILTNGETVRFCIRLENKSCLPIALVKVLVKWEEPGAGEPVSRLYSVSMDSGKSLEIPVTLETRHCGPVMLEVSRLKVYDLLKLTCFTKKEVCRSRVLVSPPVHLIEIHAENEDGSGEVLPYGTGTENMEGYQIRGYQAGDHLHRIHWKLSAKAQELQVKDFERQAGCQVNLFLAAVREEGGWDPDRWDRYLEAAFSLMFSLFAAQDTVLGRVMWQEKGSPAALDIRDESDLREAAEHLLTLTPQELSQDGVSLPEEEMDCLCLTMDLELLRGGEYLLSLAETASSGWRETGIII